MRCVPSFLFQLNQYPVLKKPVAGADLIVTATSARQPVIKREWISNGAHINAIGTYSPQAREIDRRDDGCRANLR
jgi:ornithine cyclodeaminase/alanine dehydrogenase-like protein (mu-crystallin family)